PASATEVASTPTRGTALAEAADERLRQEALPGERERQARRAAGMHCERLPQPPSRRPELQLAVEVVRGRDPRARAPLARIRAQLLGEPLAREEVVREAKVVARLALQVADGLRARVLAIRRPRLRHALDRPEHGQPKVELEVEEVVAALVER